MQPPKNLEEIASSIENVYLKEIKDKKLPSEKARHFLYRYYITEQTESSLYLLQSLSLAETKKEAAIFHSYEKQKLDFLQGKGYFLARFDDENLAKYGNLLFLYEYLKTGFYASFFGIKMPAIPEKEIEFAKAHLLKESSFVAKHTFRSISIAYYAYYQNIFDLRKELIRVLLKDTTPKDESKKHLERYCYGLTHLIIGDTNFYLQKPETSYKWILEKITEYLPKIQNLDLVLEMLLTTKLLGEPIYQADGLYQIISSKFNPKLKYLTMKETSSADIAEHYNALAILLIKNWDFPNSKKD